MSIEIEFSAHPEIPAAFVEALQPALGEETALSVGEPATAIADALPTGAEPAVSLGFSAREGDEDDPVATGIGAVTFITTTTFAERLERSASDELLLTAIAPALSAAATAIGTAGSFTIDADSPLTIELQTATATEHEVVAYPVTCDDEPVGCLVMYVGVDDSANAGGYSTYGNAAPAADAASLVLGDVEMGVTAELGRCRMTIREALSLTPGAVIDLDRAAGAPVDVLVNGTVIARGEVVVIDEEFGIRISEILGAAATVH